MRGHFDRAGVSRRLRDAREQAGFSRAVACELLDPQVHENTLTGWEDPRKHPLPLDRLAELAALYGVSVPWLLHGSDAIEPAVPDTVRADLDEIKQLLGDLLARLPRPPEPR